MADLDLSQPSQLSALEEALSRARERVIYCWTNLDRFRSEANFDDPEQSRVARKLCDDLKRAEADVAWFEKQVIAAQPTNELQNKGQT
jgi:hypothetical protein